MCYFPHSRDDRLIFLTCSVSQRISESKDSVSCVQIFLEGVVMLCIFNQPSKGSNPLARRFKVAISREAPRFK